jgi:hypothetical protein
MRNRPVHQNLDTSFVNLAALARYLRRRRFVGNIRVELNGYEADVTFTADDEMKVREHDRIAGRISEGEEALQRLLIRAREPGGIISVYETIEDDAPVIENKLPLAVEDTIVEAKQITVSIPIKTPHQNGSSGAAKIEPPATADNNSNQPLPFELSNRVEVKARQTVLTPEDWQTLLNLTAELLDTIDKSLAGANLDFTSAFEKVRVELSNDYPFLNPANEIFDYKNGKIVVRKQLNAQLFAASINEALRRIMGKLAKNPKFSNIHLSTTQKIKKLIERRKPLYDKYFITPQLERTIDV